MAGTAILSQVQFGDAKPFILALAARLQGILVESAVPVDEGSVSIAFEPAPTVDCTRVIFRHWHGKRFPVTCGAEDIDKAPKATLAIVLEHNIFNVDDDLMEAVRRVTGDAGLTQRYTEP